MTPLVICMFKDLQQQHAWHQPPTLISIPHQFHQFLTNGCRLMSPRECDFSHTQAHDTCEVNFVVSSVTMYNMWCLLWPILH